MVLKESNLIGKYYLDSTVPAQSQINLGSFIKLLYRLGHTRSPQFSFLQEHSSLLPELTLKENLFLDLPGRSLTLLGEEGVEDVLLHSAPLHLSSWIVRLSELVVDWDRPASICSPRSKKLVAMIKTFLQDPTYIFWIAPLAHLNQQDADLVLNLIREWRKGMIIYAPGEGEIRGQMDFSINWHEPSNQYVITPLKLIERLKIAA